MTLKKRRPKLVLINGVGIGSVFDKKEIQSAIEHYSLKSHLNPSEVFEPSEELDEHNAPLYDSNRVAVRACLVRLAVSFSLSDDSFFLNKDNYLHLFKEDAVSFSLAVS